MIPTELQSVANHLWQSTLFAAAAGLLTLALRQNRAQTRYWLWLAASLKFLIPFSLLLDVGRYLKHHAAPANTPSDLSHFIERASQPFSAAPPLATMIAAPPISPVNWISVVLATIWAIGFAALICVWWRRWQDLGVALRTASPLDLQIGMEVLISPAFAEPSVFGIRRPLLLLPAGITDRLTPPQLKAIVAHELSHIRRADNLVAAIHMGIESLFWFYPVVWWLGARLMEERERACDEEVLMMGSEPKEYAEGILKICDLYLESRLPCVSGIARGNLKKRIEEIMSKRIGIALNSAQRFTLLTAAVTAILVPVVVGILSAPASAQSSQAGNQPARAGLRFEVASVKLNNGAVGRGNLAIEGQRLTWHQATLKRMICEAYKVQYAQVLGAPTWTDTEMYEVEAKAESPSTRDEFREMLKNLLADRFGLAVRTGSKSLPVYVLTLAKGGPRLKEVNPEEQSRPAQGAVVNRFNRRASMSEFANLLSQMMSGPIFNGYTGRMEPREDAPATVVNQTGLTGIYDITLDLSGMAGGDFTSTLVAAVHDLGLNLDVRRMPIEIIDVTHLERSPTVN